MSEPVAWVVGGGSGIGEACVSSLAALGYRVAVSGRRADRIEAVAAAVSGAVAVPVDVADDASVASAVATIKAELGPVGVLVYSAGTNVTERFWRNSDAEALASVVDINLSGAIRAVQAVIGGMRERGDGLVVLVSSWAGWRFAPGVGVGYSASKTALGAVAETINAQERLNGIRATHFCPGEVKTEILYTRPVVPTEEQQALMLTPEDVGEAVAWVASQPARVCINELVITPTSNTSYSAP